MTSIVAIEHAFVPIIKLVMDGVKIDLQFASTSNKFVTKEDLLDDSFIYITTKEYVSSINAWRIAHKILNTVRDKMQFQLALSLIKHWAKIRGIYGNSLSFFGGISIAILVYKIFQVYT